MGLVVTGLSQEMINPLHLIPSPVTFTAALVHEIRNPLTNINLAVELLKQRNKDESADLYMDIISRASVQINILIDNLLKQHEEETLKVSIYSVHNLLDEILKLTRDRISLKNVTVTKQYTLKDHNLPLHRAEMKIALTNIVINAIDAMTIEKGQLCISTKTVRGFYVLEISDNGCGINPEDLKEIFNPFFTKKPGGLGVGLAATYDILKANGVKLFVESKEGKGTKFILSFAKESPFFSQ